MYMYLDTLLYIQKQSAGGGFFNYLTHIAELDKIIL